MDAEDVRLTRRASLARFAGFLVAVVATGGWRARASRSAEQETAATAGPDDVASGAVSCVLTPEQTEGPYYIPNEKLRRNITGGRPGTLLTLRLKVVDASTCKPIKGAAVDVWHCDAAGVYSGFGQGSGNPTFLRGIQRTGADGVATFKTIYPGWYPGRTVHIHVKVHVGGNVVHTGQLYFKDALTDAVYRKSPYRKRAAARTTRNVQDAVYRGGGRKSMLSVRKRGQRSYVGTITMGVRRA
jgi:protocatechuate 3,4-dioxygenase beta subunit